MDKKDNQWSMMMHKDNIKLARIEMTPQEQLSGL
jgi:hypothetical protein